MFISAQIDNNMGAVEIVDEAIIALLTPTRQAPGFVKTDDAHHADPPPRGRELRVNNLTDIWGSNWTDLCGMKAGKLISGVRGPELVKTPNKLLLFGQCRRADMSGADSHLVGSSLGDDMLHDRIVTISSTDFGLSWGDARFISEKATGMGVGIYNRDTKTVVYQYHSFTEMVTTTGNRLLQRTSTDEGTSWSSERDITHFVEACNSGPGGQVVGGAGSRLQTSSGRLIFSGHTNGHTVPPGGICVWYSDDGGLTYNVSASGVFVGNENSIAELSNGSLVMNGRGYLNKWKGHRTSYWSHDDGTQWSAGTELAGIREPTSAGCEGALLAVPSTDRRSSASLPRLFFSEPSGYRTDGVRTGSDRISLRVWCSTDGGRSYPTYTAINTGDGAGYSALEYATQASGEPMLVIVWEGSYGPQGTSEPPYGNVSQGTMWALRLGVDWCGR